MEKRNVHIDRNLQDPRIHDLLHPKEAPTELNLDAIYPESWLKRLINRRKDKQRKS